MSEQEKQELREAARVVREGAARQIATALLADNSLQPVAKLKVIEAALKALPMKDGALDVAAFTTLVTEAAKAEGQYLAALLGSGRVTGMGGGFAAPIEIDAREVERRQKLAEAQARADEDIWGQFLGASEAAKAAIVKGVAA